MKRALCFRSNYEDPGKEPPQIPALFWCNSHQRQCLKSGCDPRLPGILLPCRVVDLTGIAEIDSEPEKQGA